MAHIECLLFSPDTGHQSHVLKLISAYEWGDGHNLVSPAKQSAKYNIFVRSCVCRTVRLSRFAFGAIHMMLEQCCSA